VESLAAPKETPRERELRLLLEALQATLLALPQAVDVQVCRGRKSSISVHAIFATLQEGESSGRALEVGKKSMLDSAAKSKGMFVLGYRTNPFKDDESWGVSCGFSATVSYLSPGLADDACWDTYKKGFCPRRTSCRWIHPADSDTIRIRVSLGLPQCEVDMQQAVFTGMETSMFLQVQ
jgi:hypothetical protein